MKRLISAVLVLSVIGITSISNAEQMAIWDFGPNAAGYTTNPTAENLVGTPTSSLSGGKIGLNGKNGVVYVDLDRISHIDGQAAAKTWDSTTTTFDLDYRLSETAEWVAILDDQTITADSAFHAFAYSLAGIDAIENQSLVQFRFNDLDKNGNGKFALNNLEFAGPQILEPARLNLPGIGVLSLFRKKETCTSKIIEAPHAKHLCAPQSGFKKIIRRGEGV